MRTKVKAGFKPKEIKQFFDQPLKEGEAIRLVAWAEDQGCSAIEEIAEFYYGTKNLREKVARTIRTWFERNRLDYVEVCFIKNSRG